MPWVEWKPPACPSCGADWRERGSHLVGWANQRPIPCRTWVCRRCDVVTAKDDLPSAPRRLRQWDERGSRPRL